MIKKNAACLISVRLISVTERKKTALNPGTCRKVFVPRCQLHVEELRFFFLGPFLPGSVNDEHVVFKHFQPSREKNRRCYAEFCPPAGGERTQPLQLEKIATGCSFSGLSMTTGKLRSLLYENLQLLDWEADFWTHFLPRFLQPNSPLFLISVHWAQHSSYRQIQTTECLSNSLCQVKFDKNKVCSYLTFIWRVLSD